jgi:hypothetical protein
MRLEIVRYGPVERALAATAIKRAAMAMHQFPQLRTGATLAIRRGEAMLGK